MSGGDSTLALQAAIVSALKAGAGVAGLVGGRVYDRPPQRAALPYISLGVEQAAPYEAHDLDGWDVSWQIDCWSRKPGRVEIRRVMSAIHETLHNRPLVVSGHHLVMSVLTSQTALDDPDGVTTHGVQRFDFITHL